MSMLLQIGLSMEGLTPSDAVIRGMSGTDLQNCGTVCVNVTCNEISKKAKFYVTKHDYALILGLEFCKMFKLVTLNCGTVCVNVTCNEISKKAKFYVTKHDYALILGLEFCKMFKLVTLSPVCTLQSVSLEPNQAEAVHITDESEVDYHKLKTKWKEHLPLWEENR